MGPDPLRTTQRHQRGTGLQAARLALRRPPASLLAPLPLWPEIIKAGSIAAGEPPPHDIRRRLGHQSPRLRPATEVGDLEFCDYLDAGREVRRHERLLDANSCFDGVAIPTEEAYFDRDARGSARAAPDVCQSEDGRTTQAFESQGVLLHGAALQRRRLSSHERCGCFLRSLFLSLALLRKTAFRRRRFRVRRTKSIDGCGD